jgi:hypothetical protein
MAITWGAAAGISGHNFKLGMVFRQAPFPVGPNDAAVIVYCDIYLWTQAAVNDTVNTFVGWGQQSFSTHAHIATIANSENHLTTLTWTINTSHAAETPVSEGASLTGLESCGVGNLAQVSASHAVGRRPYSTPAAPTIGAIVLVGDSHCDIAWTNNPTADAPYDYVSLERRKVSVYGTQIDISTEGLGTVNSFEDTGTGANSSYEYRVRANNADGGWGAYSAWSGTVYTTPAAPTGFTAALNGANIDLSWNCTVPTSFTTTEIFCSSNGGAYVSLGVVASGSTYYVLTSPDMDVERTFRLRNIATGPIYSTYSNTSTVNKTPHAPSDIVATRNGTNIDVAWSTLHTPQWFYVLVSQDGGAYTHIGTTAGSVLSYINLGANTTKHHTYQVFAYMADGQQSSRGTSNTVEPLPVLPTNLVASRSGAQIALTWTNNSSHESGQTLQHSTNGGADWTTVTTAIAAGASTYTHTSPSLSLANLYRLRSDASDGQSSNYAQSNSLFVQIPTDGIMFGAEW